MNNVDEYGDRSITAAPSAANNEEEYCNEDLIMREIRPDSPFDEDENECGISQTLSQTLGMRDCDLRNENGPFMGS